jgi:hypothetical protein
MREHFPTKNGHSDREIFGFFTDHRGSAARPAAMVPSSPAAFKVKPASPVAFGEP